MPKKATDEQRRCRNWLLRFMQIDQQKFFTKSELRIATICEFNVSKNSFDRKIIAIADTAPP